MSDFKISDITPTITTNNGARYEVFDNWSYSVIENNDYVYVGDKYVGLYDKDLYYYEYNNGYSDDMTWKYKNTVKRMKLTNKDAHPID
jgi:hypothetical protein